MMMTSSSVSGNKEGKETKLYVCASVRRLGWLIGV